MDEEQMVEQIAWVAHEANRSYCRTLGDNSQPSWKDAPDWQKASARAGVRFHLESPDAGPEASHVNWLRQKSIEGWIYGPVKDPDTRQHPCMVGFDELPPEQQMKDHLFRAIVHAFNYGPLEVAE